MAKRPNHVPKFGNWDPNDHMPYTKIFDHARATKGVIIINPNDPAVNQDAFLGQPDVSKNIKQENSILSNSEPCTQHQRQDDMEDHVRRPYTQHRRWTSRADSKSSRPIEPISMKSPGRKSAVPSIKAGEIPEGATSVGLSPQNGISKHVIGTRHTSLSPVHPQAYPGQRLGSASPTIVRKAEAALSTPGAPSRDWPERAMVALPRFGDWDVNNPAAAAGFTMIFNKARDEKKARGALQISMIQTNSLLRHEENIHKVQRGTGGSNCFWSCFHSSAAK